MRVIDLSFQIEGSLLYLSEVSNMTLRGLLTSNESSLSSLGGCILSKTGNFSGFSVASFISIMFFANFNGLRLLVNAPHFVV